MSSLASFDQIDKRRVYGDVCRQLREELSRMAAAQEQTLAGVVHEESRAENDKDTRATEASYLARGQAERVAELTLDLQRLESTPVRDFEADDPIALSALVGVEDADEESWSLYLVTPAAGGLTLDFAGFEIRTITPKSPIGGALLGKRLDDDVRIVTPAGAREASVVMVR